MTGGTESTTPAGAVPHDLTPEEVRVLGCLVEKEATVPDSYPLTLNALRTACNQSTSRDPVVTYDDHTVERALAALRARRLTRTVHSTSNRAAKYRHVLPDELALGPAETAVLAVLMLRGPQTIGELKSRTERQHPFDSVADVAEVLERLAHRAVARQLDRRPGQKDARWVHLLAPHGADEAAEDMTYSADADPATVPHVVPVFDHGRLRIALGPSADAGCVELLVTVRAGQPGATFDGLFGGTATDTFPTAALERFLADLDRGPVGRFRLGAEGRISVELLSTLQDAAGAAVSVECTVLRTEDDPREWLQFTMADVPAFAEPTAAAVRAVLAAVDGPLQAPGGTADS